MIPRPEHTLEYLLKQGDVEAALILDPSWGKLTPREVELVGKAWRLGLDTGKQIASKG